MWVVLPNNANCLFILPVQTTQTRMEGCKKILYSLVPVMDIPIFRYNSHGSDECSNQCFTVCISVYMTSAVAVCSCISHHCVYVMINKQPHRMCSCMYCCLQICFIKIRKMN